MATKDEGNNREPLHLTSKARRLVESSAKIAAHEASEILYQHTVFCQSALPYTDQGLRREWEREQGKIALKVHAGEAKHPRTRKWVKLPLPYGPKARIVLMHINDQAIKTGSPDVEVEDSMTAFVRRIHKRHPNGRELGAYKRQLSALSTALIRLAYIEGDCAVQVDTKIITAFDIWFPKDPSQRVLWSSVIRLSHEYFESLENHAVPLNHEAIAALSDSAVQLDVYCWLAQRLHRIPPQCPQFLAWPVLWEQFGQGYARLRDFRGAFSKKILPPVVSQYPAARVEANRTGLTLRHSPPPVPARFHLVEHKQGR